jgi:GTP:adenosylcobinamide-phosphate guanylyltransferase
MAKSYGVLHKCTIMIAGRPMIARVVAALRDSDCVSSIAISTETSDVYSSALGADLNHVTHSASKHSAPASALHAARSHGSYPLLITTGDHALLTGDMVRYVCEKSSVLNADFTVGLATADIIQAAYPETRRTYFKFGNDRVSGCNLFTIHTARGLKVLERWKDMEQNRKKPWKLVFSFGGALLLRFLLGRLTLDQAFETVSRQLGITVKPLLIPFAEAAIDVDKPGDKELAEKIVARRP